MKASLFSTVVLLLLIARVDAQSMGGVELGGLIAAQQRYIQNLVTFRKNTENVKQCEDEVTKKSAHRKGDIEDINSKEQHRLFSGMHSFHRVWSLSGRNPTEDDKPEEF